MSFFDLVLTFLAAAAGGCLGALLGVWWAWLALRNVRQGVVAGMMHRHDR